MASSIPVSVPVDLTARRRHIPWMAALALAFVGALFVVAAAAPLLAPADPEHQ